MITRWDEMALMYNNLLINKNSNRYIPFLVNLISGRRKVLTSNEFACILSMMCKENIVDYNVEEKNLYTKFINEKQFITNQQRKTIEKHMQDKNYFVESNKSMMNSLFSIQLTQDCNMNCPFCFERKYADKHKQITKSMIDSIFDFYEFHEQANNTSSLRPTIRVTGGEPLITQECVDLINYIAKKWSNADMLLYTNGSNLIEFYNQLPITRFKHIDISLDGFEDVHIHSRKPAESAHKSIYKNIIEGIKLLINNQVNVNIKSVLSRDNYTHFPEFVTYLHNEGILNSSYVTLMPGIVIDYSNPLDIDESFNNIDDIFLMKDYVRSKCGYMISSFASISHIWRLISRDDNTPFLPKSIRCNTSFLSNYYFSPNGNIYFCDCMDKDKGIIGTYYPKISLNTDIINKLSSRSVMTNEKCKECPYKFVCLGNCPLASIMKDEEMSCGIFAEPRILDNLEYPYYETLIQKRNLQKENQIDTD